LVGVWSVFGLMFGSNIASASLELRDLRHEGAPLLDHASHQVISSAPSLNLGIERLPEIGHLRTQLTDQFCTI
jgi:hypothetical protein